MPFVGEPDANRVVDHARDLELVYDEGAQAPPRYRPMVIRTLADGMPVARFAIYSKSRSEADASGSSDTELTWSIHGGDSFASRYPEAAELVREAMLAYRSYCGMAMPGLRYSVEFATPDQDMDF